MKSWIAVTLMIAACSAHAWALWKWHESPVKGPSSFLSIPPVTGPPEASPMFRAEPIAPPVPGAIAHAASLCEMPDGALAAVWSAGSREAAPDVTILFSTQGMDGAEGWTPPRVIADPGSASRELGRLVRKVGNPLIFSGVDARLWLIYVTMPFGGWSGSSLNVKTSIDNGRTWSGTQRLTLSPFFNISELVRNNPVLVRDGFLLPIYHECMRDFPELLHLIPARREHGLTWRKTGMGLPHGLIQPSIVTWDERSATAFFRSTSEHRAIAVASTDDGGVSWSKPVYLDLPNPNAAVNALRIPGGRILLAFNDSTQGRENLRLAVSSDRGAHWRRIATIEEASGRELSYPYMIRDRRGVTHMVYTQHRECIQHVAFNDAWIDAHFRNPERALPPEP